MRVAVDRCTPRSWFKLEPGTGQYTGYCRLITPSQGLTLFSRVYPDPTFANYTDKNFYSDQLFKLMWEDMKVDKVDFKLDAGKILASTPVVLAEQVLTNNSNSEQQVSFSVSKTVTNTSSFEYGEGFTLTTGVEFSGPWDLFFCIWLRFLTFTPCSRNPEHRRRKVHGRGVS